MNNHLRVFLVDCFGWQEIRDKAASRAAELCPPQNGVGGPTAKVPKPDTEVQTEQVITMNL